MNPSATRELEHISALDGIRGIAIAFVLVFHLDRRGVLWGSQLGWTGVDLFFVLSGFLITRILIHTRSTTNYFRAFYARRALRIFPLYYLTLLLVAFVLPHFIPRIAIAHQWQYWLYFSNFGIIIFGWPPIVLGPLWSLAVEEHFYLLWPWVVKRTNDRQLLVLGALLIMSVIALRIALVGMRVPWPSTHYLSFSRADALIMGGLVAVTWNTPSNRARLTRIAWPLLVISASSFGGILYLARHQLAFTHWLMRSIGYTALAAAYASFLVLCINRTGVGKLVDIAPLRFLGKYSYCAYLVHMPIMSAFDYYFPLATDNNLAAMIWRIGACGGATFAVAYASWHLFERRFLRFKPAYR